MGAAKERKKNGLINKTIKKRKRFFYLCKKITKYSDYEISRAIQNRIYEGKL